MTRLARAFGLVLLLSTKGQAAEHDWPEAPRDHDERRRVSLSVSYRAGLVKAPFVTDAFPEVSGFGTVLAGTFGVELPSIGVLYGTLPMSFAWLDFPAGAQEREAALGNLELGLEHPVRLLPSTRLRFLAALLAPSAEQGPPSSLLNHRALTLGSALTGGQDSPLLTPGLAGLRLAASFEHSKRPLEYRASLDLPLLLRISDADLPEEVDTHPLGIQPALTLGVALWMLPWLGASLCGALVTEPLRVLEPALERDRRRRLQAVVEPGLHFVTGEHVALDLDASVPAGGNLGGDAWSIGLTGRLGL